MRKLMTFTMIIGVLLAGCTAWAGLSCDYKLLDQKIAVNDFRKALLRSTPGQIRNQQLFLRAKIAGTCGERLGEWALMFIVGPVDCIAQGLGADSARPSPCEDPREVMSYFPTGCQTNILKLRALKQFELSPKTFSKTILSDRRITSEYCPDVFVNSYTLQLRGWRVQHKHK